jgi:DNA-binding NtrC family response regulator
MSSAEASQTAEQAPIDLLVVDDDDELRDNMVRFFSRHGYTVSDCGDGSQAIEHASHRAFDVIVLDMMMPGITGLETLRQLKERGCEAEFVMLTGEGTIETAVEAMKCGAVEFLTKPTSLKQLDRIVRKALGAQQLRKENKQLKAVIERNIRSPGIVGESAKIKEVLHLIERTAGSRNPILIQGESGTGKELVAKALHQASPLADKPIVTINCAALPENLLESELFGHEKGAFTGAVSAKSGLFEVADGGTLFIDEFGELAGPLQAKMLRVLEDGSLRRVGSVQERRVNVRIIAATNRDMETEVNEGRFREDLYYRINVLTINLPPLRERIGDISLLAQHFVGPDWTIAPDVLPLMERYSWPGNVRQLINAIERAKILAPADEVCSENLPPEVIRGAASTPKHDSSTPADLETLNRIHVEETYRQHQGNKARTARALGIGRRSLYRLLEKYDIELGNDDAPSS